MEVLAAAASVGGAGGASEELREEGLGGESHGEEVSVVAVVGEGEVVGLECGGDGDGVGFLSDAGVEGAVEEPLIEEVEEELFGASNAEEVGVEEVVWREGHGGPSGLWHRRAGVAILDRCGTGCLESPVRGAGVLLCVEPHDHCNVLCLIEP